MSPRGSKGSASDPQPDIYTGLLLVAASSLFIGCLLLWFELARYDFTIP
jgi:hypothetical protein